MTDNDIRQVHAELMELHEEIRQEFAQIGRSTLKRYLGDFYSPDLRGQIIEHGDGYLLRSVPTCIDDMLSVDDIALFVMNFPLLDHDSVFNPHTHLATIPYWRDGKALRQEAHLDDGSSLKFHFLVWEQVCPTHGEKPARALANRQLVEGQRPKLRRLMQDQVSVSERFIMTFKEWLRGQDRQLVVLTSALKKQFDPPIAQLIRDNAVWHRPTKLTRPNRTIMERLISRR